MTREPLTPFDRTIIYGCLVFLIAGIALLAGCATGATRARQVVIGGYTAVGATAVIARPGLKQCEDKAVSDKSQAELDKCAASRAVLVKVLPATEDVLHAVPASIEAYEAIKAKDYSAVLAPLYKALGELAAGLSAAGIKLPVPIPQGAK